MGTCSNFECSNHTWGNKFRCSKCRHAKIYSCSDCGSELNSNRAIKCKSCSMATRSLQQRIRMASDEEKTYRRERYNRKNTNCLVCGIKLPIRKNKYCSDDCFISNRQKVLKFRYKQINKTSTEILS